MKLNVAMRIGPRWSTIEKKKQEEQSAPYQHDRKSGYGYLSPYTEEAGGGNKSGGGFQTRWEGKRVRKCCMGFWDIRLSRHREKCNNRITRTSNLLGIHLQ